MAHSSPASRPTKPRPDFPLFPHCNGHWAKKVLGKLRYFGKVADDPDGVVAHQRWLEQKDDLYAGRTPRPKREGLDLLALCNQFMAAKEQQLNGKEITRRTYDDYYRTARRVLAAFGKERLVDDIDAADFASLKQAMSKTRNPSSVANEVQRVRVLFNFGFDSGLMATPARYGPLFKRPRKEVLRRERQKKGKRTIEAREIRRLLKVASVPMRAMILLAINGGFGNNDCGSLPQSAVDLRAGWVDFPRPKTSVERRVPLWPETVAALKAALVERPRAKDPADDGLVFITRKGGRWAKDTADSPVSKEFRKMLDALRLYRTGLSFYTLRHQFETIAGGCKDQVAVDAIMGHVDSSMAGLYREHIDDARLRDAVNHVRCWLFRRTSSTLWQFERGWRDPIP